jgi:hypothetical protein
MSHNRRRLETLEHLARHRRPDPHQGRVLQVPQDIPHATWHAWAAEQVRPCACSDAACPGPPLILFPEKLALEEGAYREDAHHGA